jgi:hypothetical protein
MRRYSEAIMAMWEFLNMAKSTALQWMSAVFGGKMYVNGPI